MKKLILSILLLLAFSACAKTKFNILDFQKNDKNISFDALGFELDIDENEKQ